MEKFVINMKMIIKMLLVLVILIGVIILGYFFQDYIPYKNIVLLTTIILLVINVVSNIIINKKDLAKINKRKSGDEVLELLLKTKEEALNDPEAVRLKILKKYNKIRIYPYITLGLIYVILFMSTFEYGFFFGFFTFMLIYYCTLFDAKRKEELANCQIVEDPLLKNKEFNELYEIINKVVNYHNVNKEVKITCTYDDSLSIIEKDKYILIVIGYYVLRVYSKEELEASLHHEIAHFINKDTNYSLKFSKLSSSINSLADSFLVKLFYPRIYSLTFETDMLNYLSTIFYERKADEVINQVGCNKNFINGLAKMYIYGLYCEQYVEDSTMGRYDDVVYDILNKNYEYFLKYYNNNKDYINTFLTKSITGRFETHPSIAERRVNLNVDNIEISFNNELKHLADLIEEKLIKENKDEIERRHKECRKAYIKVLNDYDNINEKTTQEELISVAVELYNLSLFEKALIVCDKIFEINPKQARACFIKGAILINLYHNEEGASYLIKLIEENHSEHINESLRILGAYYASIGNMDEIVKLRSIQATTFDNSMNYEELCRLMPKDNLTEVVDDEGVNLVLDIVKNSCVKNLVVVKKTYNNSSMIHIVLVFHEKESAENVDEIRNKIWTTLDAINNVEYYLNAIPDKMYWNLRWLHKFEV